MSNQEDHSIGRENFVYGRFKAAIIINRDKVVLEFRVNEKLEKKSELVMLQHREIKAWQIESRHKDGAINVLLLTGEDSCNYGDQLEIYKFDDEKELEHLFTKSFKGMNPWQIKTCDINGDGTKELGITMYKKTKYQPFMANRPYIYYWKEDELQAMWRGSSLSRPFSDYGYIDIDKDGKSEIVALEALENSDKVIHIYKWKGFGFESFRQGGSMTSVDQFTVDDENGIRYESDNRWYTLVLDDAGEIGIKEGL